MVNGRWTAGVAGFGAVVGRRLRVFRSVPVGRNTPSEGLMGARRRSGRWSASASASLAAAFVVGLDLGLGCAPLSAQERPTLTPEDYGRWESLGRFVLSPDGRWLAYQVSRVDGTSELRIRNADDDSTRVIPRAESPSFSSDGRWLAYRIRPDEEDGGGGSARGGDGGGAGRGGRGSSDGAGGSGSQTRVGLLDLRTGSDTTWIAEGFAFSEDGGFLALEGPDAGTLLVRDLGRGTTLGLGNVGDYAWSPAGHLLATVVSTDSGAGDGVQLLDPGTGTLRSLASADAAFRGLTWREDDDDLAVLRVREDEGYVEDTHEVLVWRDLGRDRTSTPLRLDPSTVPGFPDGMRISEARAPTWSDDGSVVFLGIRPREAADGGGEGEEERAGEAGGGRAEEEGPPADSTGAEPRREDEPPPSQVEIWHARDQRIIPQQRAQASRDERRTLLSAWHLDDARFVQLGTDLMNDQEVVAGGRYVTEGSEAPYARDVMFGRPWQDVYLVDVETGARERVLERVRYFWGDSPGGRYLVYFQGEDWWTYDLQSRQPVNVTGMLDARFADQSYDYPVEQRPAYGFMPGGWLEDDAAVLLYDEFDVWAVNPDGSGGSRLTDGSHDEVVHRVVRLDPQAEAFDAGEPLWLSLFSERTKASGYGQIRLRHQNGAYTAHTPVERRIYADARIARLTKAADVQRYAFTRERFDDSPDIFVGSDDLVGADAWTETNPFQSDYAWGRAELIEFTSRAGVPLQGVLQYPAGYEEGRTYPMIVYTYEIRSNDLHRYVVPSERSYYNFQVWTQQGYFVLQPDIVYRPRDPGVSAVDAVVPAVAAVVETGVVDPERVGLIGHSWGGYQATYIPTRTDIFAAAVAGAPLTNFLSMVGSLHWNPGMPELEHWETGQARMDVPPWEDFEAHVRNSPAAFIQDLKTPMLMMQGSEDGVVDFRQGVEFYNYARRAGKDFVFLVYPGADHGLREEADQVDYHRRILQWFGHYLKGEPAPKWMTEGESWEERARRVGGSDHARHGGLPD